MRSTFLSICFFPNHPFSWTASQKYGCFAQSAGGVYQEDWLSRGKLNMGAQNYLRNPSSLFFVLQQDHDPFLTQNDSLLEPLAESTGKT
jgi:hypothetical protein